MPSQPDPDPVLFDPLEGRRQGRVPLDDATTLHETLPAEYIGGAVYRLSCAESSRCPSKTSATRKPKRKVEGGLTQHMANIEAIKGSAVVCLRCLESMRLYTLQPDSPPTTPRGILSVGSTLERRNRSQGPQGHMDSCFAMILSGRPGRDPGDNPAPGLRFKRAASGYWACPYCAVTSRGNWKKGCPDRYVPSSAYPSSAYFDERDRTVYATPYMTTHLLVATQAAIPPPVSHLRIRSARQQLVFESRMRCNHWAPYSSTDKPVAR